MKLAQNIYLYKFETRLSLKLDHLRSKTVSPGQIKAKLCEHSRGHIFEVHLIIMNLAENVCLEDF